MPLIETQRLTHYVEQRGSGRDLLVLNGTGADLRQKPTILDSPLSSDFRVSAFDQRGLGQADKPAGGYTMADYADDAAALMDALELQEVMVLGISFGGMVAQELALRHGARISRLALWCTAPGGEGGASYPLHDLAALPDETRLRKLVKLNDTRLDDAAIDANPDLLESARLRTDLSAYEHEPRWAEGRAGQLAARAGHDCWDKLAQIDCPTFLGGGAYDGIAAPAAMRAMAARLPNAILKFYEGGHFFMLQDTHAFPDLLDFFKKED